MSGGPQDVRAVAGTCMGAPERLPARVGHQPGSSWQDLPQVLTLPRLSSTLITPTRRRVSEEWQRLPDEPPLLREQGMDAGSTPAKRHRQAFTCGGLVGVDGAVDAPAARRTLIEICARKG